MVDIYSEGAERFFERYQAPEFEAIHGEWLNHLPEPPGLALDVGAGSGRDAVALAAQGWKVTAVEPAARLRTLGAGASTGHCVCWIDDQLPDLTAVRARNPHFQLILLSAVWMHLPPSHRDSAMRALVRLIDPGGLLVISLRHGPSHDERIFHTMDHEDLIALAGNHGLRAIQTIRNRDQTGREDIWWETILFGHRGRITQRDD